ncbi:MAG TPA: DUF4332 domain-containing protein [Thermosynechococcaceae cyanobacterium]
MGTPPASGAVRSAFWQIQQIPGIDLRDQELLKSHGITTTQQLCQKTLTPANQTALANHLQIPLRHVTKWAALANLARVPNVGCCYCGLLLHAGIASPAQLAQTPLDRLHRQILRLQVATMQRPDLCPSLQEVREWIHQAQILVRGSSR